MNLVGDLILLSLKEIEDFALDALAFLNFLAKRAGAVSDECFQIVGVPEQGAQNDDEGR